LGQEHCAETLFQTSNSLDKQIVIIINKYTLITLVNQQKQQVSRPDAIKYTLKDTILLLRQRDVRRNL